MRNICIKIISVVSHENIHAYLREVYCDGAVTVL